MTTTNRSCNLECVKTKVEGDVVEFIGPVKIVLIDQPPNIYRRRIWGAAFLVLAHMMLGATSMTVLFYALAYRTKVILAMHVFLCTVGYQLCVPSGILSLNKQNGSSVPMRITDRQFEHVLLQGVGVGLSLVAGILLFMYGAFFRDFTLHGLIGLITSGLAIVTVLTGLLLYNFCATPKFIERFHTINMFMDTIHKLLGTATFLASSLCFITGLWRPNFEIWVPLPQMITFLCLFCVLYTAIIVYRPIIKAIQKFF